MMRNAMREAGLFLAYLFLAVGLTWPLAIRLSTAVSDLGDPLLNAWILDWTSFALVHQPLRLFDAPIFVPSLMPLAFSEHLTGIALLVLPFHLAGASPIALHNIAMLLGFALSGYGAFVLARMFVPSAPAAFVAGIFYAFVSFKFDHLAHLQIICSGWIPLILAGLVAYWRKPGWKSGAALSAAFAMNGLTNIYFLLFTAAATAASMVVLFFIGQKRSVRFWLGLITALAVAGLVLLPFLLPYNTVSDTYNMKRVEDEVLAGSGDWSDWLRASSRSRLYGDLVPQGQHHHEREAFPGLAAVLLTAAAMLLTPARVPDSGTARATRRTLRVLDGTIFTLAALTILAAMSEPRFRLRVLDHTILSIRDIDVPLLLLIGFILCRLSIRLPLAYGGLEERTLRDAIRDSRFDPGAWVALLWIGAGVLGTLGLKTFFYAFLFDRIEAYQSIRATGRWAVIAYAGLAVWVALGVQALLQRRTGAKRFVMAAALIALMTIDVLPVIHWEQALPDVAPVYRFLKQERVQPVLEWPVDNWLAFRYLLGSAHHRVPLMNGSSGWEGPLYRLMRIGWDEKNYARTLQLAEANGCRILIVHAHWLHESDPARVRNVLRQAIDARRLVFLRRFDHGVEGDFVFAVTRNFPQPSALLLPDVPDGAGMLRAHALSAFLEGAATYNDFTFGHMESAHVGEGTLRVSGWAISPHGVREVRVLLDEGRHVFQAQRVRRADITHRFPWYYEELPGFELVLPARPRGVPAQTDVQIEIIDSNGKKTRLEDHLFTWK